MLDEVEAPPADIHVAVTVKEQDVIVALTRDGYIKRSVLASFQKAGGDAASCGLKEGDTVRTLLESNTLRKLLLFSAKGQCFALPVHQVPETRWGDVGTALVNVVGLEKEDHIVGVLHQDDPAAGRHVAFVTRGGIVKRTPLEQLDSTRSSGVVAIKLGDADEVIRVLPGSDGGGELLLVSRDGQAIRFPEEEVSVQGRAASGVRGMGLYPKDHVVDALRLALRLDRQDPPDEGAPEVGGDLELARAPRRAAEVAVFTEEGRAKRTAAAEFPRQRRGGRGVRAVRKRIRLPHRLAAAAWWPEEDAARTTVELLLSDAARAEPRPATAILSAARDGNGYDLLTVPKGTHVEGVVCVTSPVDPDAPAPPEGEPQVPAGVPSPVPALAPLTPVDTGNRGGWARAPAKETFLPGMGPEGDDVDDPDDGSER